MQRGWRWHRIMPAHAALASWHEHVSPVTALMRRPASGSSQAQVPGLAGLCLDHEEGMDVIRDDATRNGDGSHGGCAVRPRHLLLLCRGRRCVPAGTRGVLRQLVHVAGISHASIRGWEDAQQLVAGPGAIQCGADVVSPCIAGRSRRRCRGNRKQLIHQRSAEGHVIIVRTRLIASNAYPGPL